MKDQYIAIRDRHVTEAVKRAVELGAKATWPTEKHHAFLVECIEADLNDIKTAVAECYNVSAMQQFLEAKFKATGHFARKGKMSPKERVDDALDALAKSLA